MTAQSPAAKTSGRLVRIWRSTTIACLTPSSAPAAAARSRVGSHADDDEHDVGRVDVSGSPPSVRWRGPRARRVESRRCVIASTRVLQCDLDAVALELGVDERAELGVDGRQHLGQLLELGDLRGRGR